MKKISVLVGGLVLGGVFQMSQAATFNLDLIVFFTDASEEFTGQVVVNDSPTAIAGGQRFSLSALTFENASHSQSWIAGELTTYYIDLFDPNFGNGFSYSVELPLPVGLRGGVEPYFRSSLGFEELDGPDAGTLDVDDIALIHRDLIPIHTVAGASSFAGDKDLGSGFPNAPGANIDFSPIPEPSGIFFFGIGIAGIGMRRKRSF